MQTPTEEFLTEGMLLGIGNPLLDISAIVEPELLQKYGMKEDDAIMAGPEHMPLYEELTEKYQVSYIAGGSVQNSLRVANWILRKPHLTTYFGSVGNDEYAKILKKKAQEDGVVVHYQIQPEHPTGTCAVLVTGVHRSLCANLAAAQHFTPDHLDTKECANAILKAKYIYTSGFFIAVSPESILKLAQHAHDNNLLFMLNVSAPFVMQFYKEPLEKILPYADILIGNELECQAFAKEFNFGTDDMTEIAKKMAALPKLNARRPRLVVCTQGASPVILVQGGDTKEVPVARLAAEEIVDTNGAGDAFVGGFLSQLVLGKSYTVCCHAGIYAARHVIQHSGCTFEGESTFSEVECTGPACTVDRHL